MPANGHYVRFEWFEILHTSSKTSEARVQGCSSFIPSGV